MTSRLVLHSFFRSSTSFRVRTALAVKELEFDQETYNFRENAQRSENYLKRNPQGLVPTLTLQDGEDIHQSLAILEWLEEKHPHPPLLPADASSRARVRSLAHTIALDIHPINNLRVLNRLREQFGADDEQVKAWFLHWVSLGFEAFETRLANETDTGKFCHGDSLSMADICLVAQSVNNQRFGFDETPFPTIRNIVDRCLQIPAFQSAMPSAQPDAV